ncbi:MAG: ATP-binding cassette domain-containing protein [Symbiopectobacterium sp.]
MDTELLLDIQGMSVEFPGIKALDSIDFTLRKGEIVALLGENGARKSTLIKALTGIYRHSAGEIFLEGNAIDPLNTAHSVKHCTRAMLRHWYRLSEGLLLPNLSVAANFFGPKPLRFGMIDQKEMARLAREIVAYYGLRIDVTDPLGNYSIAI